MTPLWVYDALACVWVLGLMLLIYSAGHDGDDDKRKR
jgi:hypothetical protein